MAQNFGNRIMAALINSPLHRLMGDSMAVITVSGRKSGTLISTPINVTRNDDGWTATSLRTRTWWRNLRGNAPAQLRVQGKTYAVRGRIHETPQEVQNDLLACFRRNPSAAKYFKVAVSAQGEPNADDLAQASLERVTIQLTRV